MNLSFRKLKIVSPLWRVSIVLWPATVFLLGMAVCAQTPKSGSSTPAKVSHLDLGREYGRKGQWTDAERELSIYKNTHPDSVDGIMLYAEALIQLNQPFDAALALQKFLQTHPESVRPLQLHATLAENTLQDNPLAQSEWEKATKLSPNDPRPWKALAQIYMDQENMASAMPALKRAAQLAPNDAVVHASLGYAEGQTNEPKEASAQFAKALQMAKNSPQDNALVQMLYGRYLLESGRAKESLESFSSLLKVNPKYASGYYWRARAYQQMNDLKAAENDALESIQMDPNGREAPLLLVTIYRKEGNAEKAQEYADLVKRLGDEHEAQQAKGRKLRNDLDQAEHMLVNGNFAEAAPRYEAIVQILPNYYEAYFGLGMCYAQTGRPGDAETAFRKYLSFQPVSSDGRAALGVLLLSEGRGKEAVPELEQAIQIDPTLIEARKALAGEYLQESNPKAALSTLKGELNSKDADTQLILAEAYRQTQQFSLALKAVDHALTITPGEPQALQLKQQILKQQESKTE